MGTDEAGRTFEATVVATDSPVCVRGVEVAVGRPGGVPGIRKTRLVRETIVAGPAQEPDSRQILGTFKRATLGQMKGSKVVRVAVRLCCQAARLNRASRARANRAGLFQKACRVTRVDISILPVELEQ